MIIYVIFVAREVIRETARRVLLLIILIIRLVALVVVLGVVPVIARIQQRRQRKSIEGEGGCRVFRPISTTNLLHLPHPVSHRSTQM